MSEINYRDYKPSSKKGLSYILLPFGLAVSGLYLSLISASIFGYIVGQLLLALFFFQCFILLHECGHMSFFRSRKLNQLFGNFMAFISFIPFKSWVLIHNLHHKWTGYRDKDPTTEGTINPKFNGFLKGLINLSWLLYLPLFTIGYRLGNYWTLKKLKKHLPERKLPAIKRNMIIQLMMYAVLIYFFHNWLFTHLLPAYFLSLMISDLFILSQHSHIKIPLSNGEKVKPLRFSEQVQYTRSITFFKRLGGLVFLNFNLHEAHHAYPSLPAYHLAAVKINTENTVPFLDYLKSAKSLKGTEFIFNSSDKKIG
jgi:fatty acid desaturase